MSVPFIHRRRVQFAETDMAGIVHFANYYRYMEEAEHAYLNTLGLSVMQTQADGTVIGWPRVRSSCSYESPACFEDELEIRLWVSRKGARSLTFDVEFWRGETRLARGSLKTVCCLCRHDKPLQSIDIPPAISALIVESPPPGNGGASGAAG